MASEIAKTLLEVNPEVIEVIKDLNAGTIGGVAGIVAGQPFDTVKVRLQTQAEIRRLGNSATSAYAGATHCFKEIVRGEGVRGLYKGMLSPIISNAPINAVVFAIYGRRIRELELRGAPVKPSDHFIAGAAAGFLQTVFSSPAELIKIKLQVDNTTSKQSAINQGREVLRHNGVFKGLYQGWTLTAMRDTPAFGVYFYSYILMKNAMAERRGVDDKVNAFMSGGIAGTLSWALLHPVDVVKSLVQMQPPEAAVSTREVIKRNYSEHGARFFMNGFVATCFRAFPVSAVTFVFYETVIGMLES